MKNQNKDYIDKTINNLHKYKVDIEDFFLPQEHLMYVSPIDSYKDIVPSQYKNKIKSVIDIHKIVDEVWNNSTSDEIDCRGVLFLNKCHINEIHTNEDIFESWNKDKKFILSLRSK